MDRSTVQGTALTPSVRARLKSRKPSTCVKAFSRTIKHARHWAADKKRLILTRKQTTSGIQVSRRKRACREACDLLQRSMDSRDYRVFGTIRKPSLRRDLQKCFLHGARTTDIPQKFRSLALKALKRCVLTASLKPSRSTTRNSTQSSSHKASPTGPQLHLLTLMLHSGQKVIESRKPSWLEHKNLAQGEFLINDKLLELILRYWPYECETGKNPSVIEQALLNSEALKERLLSQAVAITGHIDKIYVATIPSVDQTYVTPLLHALVTPAAGPAASLSTIRLVIAKGADVNVIDAEGQTALWKSLTSRRRRRHCDSETIRVLIQAGAKIEKPFELFDEVLRTLVSKQSVSGDVKSLAVCTWLRKNSLYKLRMFNNRKSRVESLDPFHLFGMYILSRFCSILAEGSKLDLCVSHNDFSGTKVLLWYGVPATDVVIDKVPRGPVKDALLKRISKPLSLKKLCARQILLSMKDLTMDSFSSLTTPPRVNRRLAATVGFSKDEIRAMIPTTEENTNFSSYIDTTTPEKLVVVNPSGF